LSKIDVGDIAAYEDKEIFGLIKAIVQNDANYPSTDNKLPAEIEKGARPFLIRQPDNIYTETENKIF